MAIRKASIVLVVVFSLELIALAAAELEEDVDCPDGWIPLHRGCYQFVTSTKQGWHEGNKVCNDSNAQLTSIQSTKERDAINNYINQYHSNEHTWWVGFERNEVKGENWVWLAKGERVTRNLIKWKSRRQAARRGTVCGCLEFQHHGMKLSNNKCAKKMPFICEFHSIASRPTTPTPTTKHVESTLIPEMRITLQKEHVLVNVSHDAKTNSSQENINIDEKGEDEIYLTSPPTEPLADTSGAGYTGLPLNPCSGFGGNASDVQLYRAYLLSVTAAETARVHYYAEVSRMYSDALEKQKRFYELYEEKLELEVAALKLRT